jgi:hypothetical protein
MKIGGFMKCFKLCFLFILLIPVLLFAEDEVETQKNAAMSGSVGTMLVGGKMYTQIRLMPELRFGKIGIGFDIDLLIDGEGNPRKEDWDEWQDYVNKVLYIRYGQRGDTFFGKIGSFSSYSLGRGLVMRDYNNMLRYPEYRQIGLQLGGRLPVMNMTIEGFSANITENDILAARATIQPLPEALPILNNMTFGATVAHDRNQINGLIDSDDDGYADDFDDYPYDDNWYNEVDYNMEEYWVLYQEWVVFQDSTAIPSYNDFETWFSQSDFIDGKRNPSFSELGKAPITVIGVDYELPLITTDLFKLSNYGEIAQIIDHKMGFIFPGFYSKFLIFHANLEFRYYQEDFMPAFFDQLYDEKRVTTFAIGDSTSLFVKEDLLAARTEARGWYGSLTSNLFNFLILTVSYEDMYGENDVHHRSIWGRAGLQQKIIPQIVKAEINYYQTGFDKLRYFKTENAQVDGALGYALAGSTTLVAKYSERYRDWNGDGKISGKHNDKPETIKTFGMGVEFRF